MPELMTVTVEVWPVAADEAGIWLVSGGDAWRFGPVEAASDVHYEVEMLLFQRGIDPDDAVFIRVLDAAPRADVIHSTSWRPDGPTIVLTYMAVIRAPGYVLERWPDAAPVTSALPRAVGKAPPHGAAEVPVPRLVDVLLHGIRHLKFLAGPDGDAETAAALDGNWLRHLAQLRPALATMFSERLAASAHMTADRTVLMLRALAGAPGGLSTAEVAAVAAADIQPHRRAMHRTRRLLEDQAGRGRVRQAATVPAERSKVPMIVWQITDGGCRYLAMSPQDRRKRASARPFVSHDVPLGGGGSARLRLPAGLTAGEAEQLCELIRSLAAEGTPPATP